jgi:membrane protein DedA with SNARE-associated domain
MSFDPSHLFDEYGPRLFPYVVFGCAVFENDVTFIMAGIYAASLASLATHGDVGMRPHVDLVLGIVAGVLGALCHDSFWFFLGHNNSGWLKKTPAWKRLGPQIEYWSSRFGVRELFFCRFIPGTRNVSVLFWGIQQLSWTIFLAIDAASLAIWGTVLVTVGYKFGQSATALLGRVKQRHFGRWLLLALLITAIIYYVVRAFTKHEIVKYGKLPEDPRAD